MSFDYNAPAELFLSKRAKVSRIKYFLDYCGRAAPVSAGLAGIPQDKSGGKTRARTETETSSPPPFRHHANEAALTQTPISFGDNVLIEQEAEVPECR